MKRIFITVIFIIAIVSFFLFFKKINYKNIKNGNNIISNSTEENILNMNSYKAQIEVTVNSNKNTNKYIIKQEYKENDYAMQEVLQPENIAGVKFNYKDNKLTIENTKLNLQTIYENYQYMGNNNLFLDSFIEDYKQDENAKREENEEQIILKAKISQPNKYMATKKLFISKKTGKPIKLEVQDTTQNISVYILYNEIEIN